MGVQRDDFALRGKWIRDSANDNDLGFTGHIEDTGLELTYMQARYYDPFAFSLEPLAIVGKLGRLLSNDPVLTKGY